MLSSVCQQTGTAKISKPKPASSLVPAQPKGMGKCVAQAACEQCVLTQCEDIFNGDECMDDPNCVAASSCLKSTIGPWHIAHTPVECTAMECARPCLAQQQSSPGVARLATCTAGCLPGTGLKALELVFFCVFVWACERVRACVCCVNVRRPVFLPVERT